MRENICMVKRIGRLALCLLLIYAGSLDLSAQSAGDFNLTPPKVVPPSPEVASLFKFSELPVAYYTGLPQVGIPVYDLKLKDITIPVSLQYHTGAIKVDEVASNVGIGWSLNAGGSINALVRGKEDWLNGYPANAEPISTEILTNPGIYDPYSNPNGPKGGVSYNWCKTVMNGLVDPEPDMFNFTAPEIGGKFFYDQQAEVHTVPVQPLKISRMVENGLVGFRVVNAKGVIYDFHEKEISFSNTGSSNYNWYLSRIITPARDTVVFTYQKLLFKYNSFFGESRAKYLSGFYNLELMTQVGQVMLHDNIYDTTTVNGSRIQSISCNNGTKIDFMYATSQRYDLPGANALTGISILYRNELMKKFNLVQQYVGNTASADKNRLRLIQVYEGGPDGVVVAPYKFFYDDSKQMPDRLDNGQDHWGYYNGKRQDHRIPKNEEFWPGDSNSANRDPDTSFSHAGMMTGMQYPTGGTVTFDYEPNDVWVENEQTVTTTRDGAGCGGVPFTTTERFFTIPVNAKNKRINYNTYAQYIDPGPPFEDPPVDDNPTCNIYVVFPDGHLEYFSGINSNPVGDSVAWPAGNYRVTVDTYGDNSRAYFSIAYEVSDTSYYTGSRIVGGWRIKRIAYKDPFSPAKDKVQRFDYAADNNQPNRSSGKMPSAKPVYEYKRTPAMYKRYTETTPYGEMEWYEYKACEIIMQSANSLMPLWNDHGHVFYPRVTVYDGENGENGKTVYYHSYLEPRKGNFGYPFAPQDNVDWLNGLLVRKDEYRKNQNGSYTLLRTTENRYSTAPDSLYWRHFYNTPEPIWEDLKGVGLIVAPIVTEVVSGFTFYEAKFDVRRYNYLSKWHHLDTTIVTESTGNPGETIQTVTSYSYMNGRSLQPTEIKIENSKKEVNRILNTYPNEYSTTPYLKMLERNIVAPVVEEKRYKGTSSLLLRTKTNYDVTASDLVLPSSIERSFFGQTPYTEITYDRYDDNGNILQYTSKDGIVHALIWGYKKNFPVAEIQGSNYNTALSFINPAILETNDDQQIRTELNKIRTGLANTGALVATYTYAPLIGITSSTDATGRTTFFESDGLGRLKLIKDQNGKILKQFGYQYQKPITQ